MLLYEKLLSARNKSKTQLPENVFKNTSRDVVRPCTKVTVKALFTTVSAQPVFKPAFLHYLCLHLRSPVEIKDCALNVMIACVNYREI